MEIFCPNCKKNVDLVKIDGVDFIQCPDCGWFKTQADGSTTACDPPPEPVAAADETPKPARGSDPAAMSEGGESNKPAPTQPPSGTPGPDVDDVDDDDMVNVRVTFED